VLLSLQILNLYLKSREKKEEEKRLIFFNSSATLCMRYFFFLTKSISLIKYHVHSEEIKIVNMIGKHLQTKEKNQIFFLLVLCFLFFAVCLVCDVCC